MCIKRCKSLWIKASAKCPNCNWARMFFETCLKTDNHVERWRNVSKADYVGGTIFGFLPPVQFVWQRHWDVWKCQSFYCSSYTSRLLIGRQNCATVGYCGFTSLERMGKTFHDVGKFAWTTPHDMPEHERLTRYKRIHHITYFTIAVTSVTANSNSMPTDGFNVN